MAIHPNSFSTKQSLQPGARGQMFQANMPGYRNGEDDRINRTNMKLAVSEHDTPNIKWELDRRLPRLFTYGFAKGYNQMVMPKGRVVAVDKTLMVLDTETLKAYNALTLANGGADVKLRGTDYVNVQDTTIEPVGVGTQWAPLKEGAYEVTEKGQYLLRPFKPTVAVAVEAAAEGKKTAKAKAAPEIGVDVKTGLVTVSGRVVEDVRLGNTPIGIIGRNEYTRDDNAHNGMQPGPVHTDKLVELPLFLVKEKAELNPFGSAYGNLLSGDLVKSDENGRIVLSPLSVQELVATMSAGEIELERQQVIGQVYAVSRDLVPAGAAKYAQWALSDRLNFEEFNPDIWRQNNRTGEDNIAESVYGPMGGGYFNSSTNMTDMQVGKGSYPYDRTMHENDLHMLESTVRTSSNRFGLEHMLEQGIPGLTDGYNVASRELGPEELGSFSQAVTENDYAEMIFKTADVSLESLRLAVGVDSLTFAEINESQVGQLINFGAIANAIKVEFVSLKQGMLRISVNPEKKAEVHAALAGKSAKVVAKYNKRGLVGVPTNLDWDGCAGVVTVLLQK